MKKKTPVEKDKKTGSKKSQRKEAGTDNKVLLAKELSSLIPKLDAEGLAFLVKQARIHLYNMQVDELNKAAQEAYSASARSKTQKSNTQSRQKKEKFNIDATGTGYYLRYQNDGIIFSKNEMVHLVKIVNGQGTDIEISGRLYNWFQQERRDIFAVIPIADRLDSRLKSLAAIIKKNFKLK